MGWKRKRNETKWLLVVYTLQLLLYWLTLKDAGLRRLAGRAWALLYQTSYTYTTQANNVNTLIEQSLGCVYNICSIAG